MSGACETHDRLDPVTCKTTRLPAGLLVAEGFASGEGDPDGVWLRELQRILRQMIAGECKPTTPEWNAAIATKPGGLPVVSLCSSCPGQSGHDCYKCQARNENDHGNANSNGECKS